MPGGSWSLRSRLLGLVMLAFVPAFGVVGWSAYQARAARLDKAYDHIGDLAQATAQAHERLIESARGLLAGLAAAPEVRSGDFGACGEHFARARLSVPFLANIGVADLGGRLRCTAIPVRGDVRIGDREYFRRALGRDGFGIGAYHLGRATGRHSIGFGMAVHGADRRRLGVAFAAFDLRVLDQLAEEARAPAGALIVTADRNGAILSSRPPQAQPLGEAARDPALRRLLISDADATQTHEAPGSDALPWLFAIAPVVVDGERVLTVAVGIPKRAVFAPIDRALTANLLVLAAVLAAALAAIWFGYERSIVRPVQEFLRAVQRIARGELDARAPPPGSVREFNAIQVAFNDMAQALEMRVSALERAERALRTGEERYRALFELSPDAVFVHAEGRIRLINGAGARMYGAAHPGQMVGKPILDIVAPRERERVQRRLAHLGSGAEPLSITEIRQSRLDGSEFVGEVYTAPYAAEGPRSYVTEVRDVTERHDMEQALRESESQYRTLFEKSPVPMWVFSLKSLRFLAVNEAAVAHYGYSREEFLQMSAADIRPPEDIDKLLARVQDLPDDFRDAGIWRHRKKDGSLIEVHIDDYGLSFRGESARLVLATDVTERRKYEARIEYLATHDDLTRLPNRNLFADRLAQAVTQARRGRQRLAVLVFDLDNFKIVNDSFGHAGGDAILRGVAERFSAALREGDTVARLGGDEFVILLTGIERSGDIAIVIRKLQDALSQPFYVDRSEVFVTGSIGVSVFPADGADVATLLRNADVAMYKVKEAGRNSAGYFTADLSTRATERVELESGLRRALERDEFEIHYQPQVDMRARRIVGAEALVRWRHPQRGLVPPGEFIRVAEETGLILPIGNWMLVGACRQAQAWRDAGLGAIRVAVNVSARQFRDRTLADIVRAALEQSGLDPGSLELELTEGLAMGHVEGFIATLTRLKTLGVGIAIDDFGTGYSSLSYLKRFPIDKVKIDQSFVHNLPGSADDAAIARTIIALGRTLGLAVTAEGVENFAQLEFLQAEGCDQAQGFHFGRPAPAPEFERGLRAGLSPGVWRRRR